MAIKLTKEQSQAVEARGNVLVSAAAGSGKTAVLVERVIERLTSKNDFISADRLLIVTFTNAAAAEMRGRIEKRLDEICLAQHNNPSLLMQKHLIKNAKICTIDSFCIDLVRENFEKLGVSPDFKISNGLSLKAIDEAVITKIIEEYMLEGSEEFLRLLDIVGTEFDDATFMDFLLSLYNYSRQLPFPKDWFKSFERDYCYGEFSEDCVWAKFAFNSAARLVAEMQTAIKNGTEFLTVTEGAVDTYGQCFSEAMAITDILLEKVLSCKWDNVYEFLNNFTLPKLSSTRRFAEDNNVATAKEIYKDLTKSVERLQKLFYADSAFLNCQFKLIYPSVKVLVEILEKIEDNLFEEYNRQNVFTFHNTEHLALKLLCQLEDGKITKRTDTAYLLERFDEVMVDEYQDTNDLQDMLFYVLSEGGKKLFAVGDVKQSIYGFRGANPKNFLRKITEAIPYEKAEDSQAKKIILSSNFRCKPESCGFINYFFKIFMNNETGDLVYNEDEQLVAKAEYPKISENSVEINLIECNENKDIRTVAEAKCIGEYILKTINSGDVIRADENNLRKAKYSDFAILLRSAKGRAMQYAHILSKMGIPVDYASEEFVDRIEIATFLNLLAIIDNPVLDVELLSVMMSPIFNFSADEMARIRIENPQGSLYSCVINLANKEEIKARDFIKKIEKYRLMSVTNSLGGFISELLVETGYLDIVSAMAGGSKRRANLLLLCKYAEQFSSDGYSSVGGFVKRIKNLSNSGIKGATVSSTDAVTIMSIHASKGLQFPVCIVADLANEFNDAEVRQPNVYSTALGVGFKYFDEDKKEKVTTLSRESILYSIKEQSLSEELRLFYVALTRTQDKLMLISALPDLEKKVGKISFLLSSTNGAVNSYLFSKTKSYSDWLLAALLLHKDGKPLRTNSYIFVCKEDDSKFTLNIHSGERLLSDNSDEIIQAEVTVDTELSDLIKENISYFYPFDYLKKIESKVSVSSIAKSQGDREYAFTARPAFMLGDGLAAEARGTAMHKVIEYFDFSNKDDIEGELERLYEWQFITEKERNSVNRDALKVFFESNLFNRIENASVVKREMRFLTEASVKELNSNLGDNAETEGVIIQGAVDLCFVEDDGVVILDFKTDRVRNEGQLISLYKEQLELYAKACEKIFLLPVKSKIIYSFSLNKEIEL